MQERTTPITFPVFVCVCVCSSSSHKHNLTQSNFSYKGDFDLHEGACVAGGWAVPGLDGVGSSVWASKFRKGRYGLDAEMQSARGS